MRINLYKKYSHYEIRISKYSTLVKLKINKKSNTRIRLLKYVSVRKKKSNTKLFSWDFNMGKILLILFKVFKFVIYKN